MNLLALGKPLRKTINVTSDHSSMRGNILCSIDCAVFDNTDLKFFSLWMEANRMEWSVIGQYTVRQIYHELTSVG